MLLFFQADEGVKEVLYKGMNKEDTHEMSIAALSFSDEANQSEEVDTKEQKQKNDDD